MCRNTYVVINFIIGYILSAYGVNIIPQHAHLSKSTISQRIICQASQPFSRCEFKVFDLTHRDLRKVVLDEKHTLEELKSRQCTTWLPSRSLEEDHYYMVACRVRSDNSDWEYNSMSVYKSEAGEFPLTIPKHVVVLAFGDSMNVAVRGSSTRLEGCSFKQQATNEFIGLFNFSLGRVFKKHYRFYGDGEDAFQNTCGVTIDEANWNDNGVLILKLDAKHTREITFVNLIVATEPTILRLVHETFSDKGSMMLRARCTVIGGRPAPKITWLLGGSVVDDNAARGVVSEEWAWPFEEQTVEQTLTLTLNDSLSGKEVRCSATHVALTDTLDDAFTIDTNLHSSTATTGLGHSTAGDGEPSISSTTVGPSSGVETVNVAISPQHIHFKYDTAETITCKSSQPLSACQFGVFDLTSGNITQVELGDIQTKRSLPNGQCDITLKSSKLTINNYYIATCRVRSSISDWSYAYMSVYKSESDKIPLIFPRREMTAMPGSSLNISIRLNSTGHRLTSCEIKHPQSVTFTYLFPLDNETSDNTCETHPEFYAEDNRPCGQTCGVTLNNITEDDNGILVFRLKTAHSTEISFVSVIVAKPPIKRQSHRTIDNDDGSLTLETNCTVTDGRPAPLITWYLGGDVVTGADVMVFRSKEWTWPFQDQTVRQRLNLKLNHTQVGKEVWCSVQHVAMNGTTDDKLEMRKDRNTVPWLYVIIGILGTLLILFLVIVIVYAWRKKLGCFAHSKVAEEESVKYRRSLDASLKYEETYSQPNMGPRFTISSMDRSSAVTGLEYAEIRVSVVQRCLDKMAADTAETLSPETGERLYEPMRPNSMYEPFKETK